MGSDASCLERVSEGSGLEGGKLAKLASSLGTAVDDVNSFLVTSSGWAMCFNPSSTEQLLSDKVAIALTTTVPATAHWVAAWKQLLPIACDLASMIRNGQYNSV